MISETIGPYNAIGTVAQTEVEAALGAGWQVSVIAKRLHESLHGRVEWLKLYVPPRGFALQWLTARHFIKNALGRRTFDVVHGHQPQIADLCDVFQCHFLTRAAYERGCLHDGTGLRGLVDAAQKRLVLYAEDYFYGRWNSSTHMLFNSDLTRSEFGRLYGLPEREEILLYSAPPVDVPSPEERRSARQKFLGRPYEGIVAGFLGGLHERKGYRRILHALRGERDIFLLMGGLHCQGFRAPELNGHFHAAGLVESRTLYAASDVLLLPSLFEPFGLVALEAASRGVPVIATDNVGALPHLLQYGAGMRWDGESPLAPIIREIVFSKQREMGEACRRLAESHSLERHNLRLLDLYSSLALPRPRCSGPVDMSAGGCVEIRPSGIDEIHHCRSGLRKT